MDEEVRRLASRGEESRNVARVKQGDYMVEDNVVQTVTVKTERDTHSDLDLEEGDIPKRFPY